MHFGVKNKKKMAGNSKSQKTTLVKEVTSTLGRGMWGFGGSPPFEEATSTPDAGVGGLGGPLPFKDGTSTPGTGVGGFGGPPIR